MKDNNEHEWTAGYRSGMLHDCYDHLCVENNQKATKAILSTYSPPAVKAYWQGYLDGVCNRGGK